MFILEILFLIVISIISIPVFIILVQTILFSFSTKKVKHDKNIIPDDIKTVLLMPAHNESLVIEKTLLSIQSQLSDKVSLLVIADNCSDDTAAIAKKFDANVLERTDKIQRGKGFALDFGIQFLKRHAPAPDVVIIIDADCILSENCVSTLIYECIRYKRPIQSLYLMESQGPKTRIAEFAWRIKNFVRPWGWSRIGGPCQLMGSGMAFPWCVIESSDLANGNIVEDMKLGIELTKKRSAPKFCINAQVTSYFPTSNEGIDSQRTRWEHGHLATIINEVPSLLKLSFCSLNYQTLLLALDLLVPPLSLLLLLSILCGLSGICVGVVFSFSNLILLSLALLASFMLFFLLAWFHQGKDLIDIKMCYSLFLYIFKKIPLYVKFIVNKQVDWVRSKRD